MSKAIPTPQTVIIQPPIAGPINLARLKFMAPMVTTDEIDAWLTNLGPSDIRTGLYAEAIIPDDAAKMANTISSISPKVKKR